MCCASCARVGASQAHTATESPRVRREDRRQPPCVLQSGKTQFSQCHTVFLKSAARAVGDRRGGRVPVDIIFFIFIIITHTAPARNMPTGYFLHFYKNFTLSAPKNSRGAVQILSFEVYLLRNWERRRRAAAKRGYASWRFLRTIVWFGYFFGALIALLPVMAKARRKKAAGDADAQAYIHKYVRMWAGTLLRIAGVTVTVRGAENIPQGRAVMFTPNHQGDYDIPLMLLYLDRPHGIVAKIETKKIPMVAHVDGAARLHLPRPQKTRARPWRPCARPRGCWKRARA